MDDAATASYIEPALPAESTSPMHRTYLSFFPLPRLTCCYSTLPTPMATKIYCRCIYSDQAGFLRNGHAEDFFNVILFGLPSCSMAPQVRAYSHGLQTWVVSPTDRGHLQCWAAVIKWEIHLLHRCIITAADIAVFVDDLDPSTT